MLLGFARGSVGDVTFARYGGQQIARARNRQPKNPQTILQMTQRVIMATTTSAYSALREICNHSWEGVDGAAANQRKFISENNSRLRDWLADLYETGLAEDFLASTLANFTAKGDSSAALNEYKVSHGSITPITYQAYNDSDGDILGWFIIDGITNIEPTYQELLNANPQLQQGDQLTWLWGYTQTAPDEREGSYLSPLNYARMILDPIDGDLSHPLPFEGTETYRNPKDLNTDALTVQGQGAGSGPYLIKPTATVGNCAYIGLIVSRWDGTKWMRSTEYLKTARRTHTSDPLQTRYQLFLGDAITSYMQNVDSSYYLNQATT